MNARATAARRIIKARRNEAKAHKAGLHTVTSHALRAGISPEDAAGIGNAIRAKAKVLGVTGATAHIVRRTEAGITWAKNAKRYTVADIALLLTGYRPRLAKYVAAKAALAAYVAA